MGWGNNQQPENNTMSLRGAIIIHAYIVLVLLPSWFVSTFPPSFLLNSLYIIILNFLRLLFLFSILFSIYIILLPLLMTPLYILSSACCCFGFFAMARPSFLSWVLFYFFLDENETKTMREIGTRKNEKSCYIYPPQCGG